MSKGSLDTGVRTGLKAVQCSVLIQLCTRLLHHNVMTTHITYLLLVTFTACVILLCLVSEDLTTFQTAQRVDKMNINPSLSVTVENNPGFVDV